MSTAPIFARIAEEISASIRQVEAAALLLDEGATVPFIARYRKEVTGGLDDSQLRVLAERLIYLRELEDRRAVVLKSIAEQDKLTAELEAAINEADSKTRLEDLYLPYKPRRRTKAQIAREAGIEPLLDALQANPNLSPEVEAAAYLNAEAGFADAEAVLEGAKQILMERFAEHAELLAELRDLMWRKGELKSQVMIGKEQEAAKFRDYFEFAEPIHKVPSHRALALFRGRNESLLMLSLSLPEEHKTLAEGRIAQAFDIENKNRPADAWFAQAVVWGWKVKLAIKIELDLFNQLREAAEEEAIRVFGANLKDLLLAAPAGPRATIGLDPGLRTGVKVAVVDATGKVLDTGAIYPHAPKNQWDQSVAIIAALAKRHGAELIAIGNGTASRETDKLAAEVIKKHPALKLTKVVVSEAGASVYSASEVAAKEFPDMDVSLRGAVSIARRLQDPLAELVKIEPKSIGVGQYQHDVSQIKLARQLEGVVEDCVNAVGVDLNMASVPLLARVAGLSESVATQIVMQRDSEGAFRSREALKAVPRLGDKTFEQCAGFLRINGGDNPLDASAVHPEAYPLVEKMAQGASTSLADLIGNATVVKGLRAADFADDQFGLPTVQDVLRELDKPGRDPRPEFATAAFDDSVHEVKDLRPGMILEGTVTNVANFGAFVDVGVHQDGLVHISALAKNFVKDPRDVVKAGQVVKVKVLEVDVARKRIAMTMRLDDPLPSEKSADSQSSARDDARQSRDARQYQSRQPAAAAKGSMAAALSQALGK